MVEHHEHWSDFVDWIAKYWMIISFVMVSGGTAIWWSLHRVFATHDKMLLCKSDLVSSLNKHEEHEDEKARELKEELLANQLAYQRHNEEQHTHIARKIDHLTDIIIDNMRQLK
jgi:hypothetical protein